MSYFYYPLCVERNAEYMCVRCMCVSLQSCDGSEYTLQGPAGGDDITGLSAEPAHYQLLSELGESAEALSQTLAAVEALAES